MKIVAAPWRSKAPTTDLVAEVLAELPAAGHPGAGAHGGVDVLDPDPDKPSLIRLAGSRPRWPAAPCTMWRWGTSIRRPRSASGRVWYSGSPEVTNFDDVESDPGHVLVVDIDETDRTPVPWTATMSGAGGSSRCAARRHQPRHRRPRLNLD